MSTSRARPAPAARRRRALVAVSALFAGAVLLTGLPVSSLLAQRQQLAGASAQLRQLQAADQSLAAQSRRLTDPTDVSGLARTAYGLVPPGQKAYVILPPPGASPSAVAGSGHVPLEGPPVVPGSAQSQALLGVGPAGPTAGASQGRPARGTARAGSSGSAIAGGSFWSRVVRTLEFWR